MINQELVEITKNIMRDVLKANDRYITLETNVNDNKSGINIFNAYLLIEGKTDGYYTIDCPETKISQNIDEDKQYTFIEALSLIIHNIVDRRIEYAEELWYVDHSDHSVD